MLTSMLPFHLCNIAFIVNIRFSYPTAIDMVSTGKISVKPLITHHFKIEDTQKAFDTAKNQIGNPIKILIHANPEWKPS